jgi:two-component system chemotaxis sensor kinase CheA
MFDTLEGGMQPGPADPAVIAALRQVLAGNSPATAKPAVSNPAVTAQAPSPLPANGPDWNTMFQAIAAAPATPVPVAAPPPGLPASQDPAAQPEQVIAAAIGRRATDKPGAPAPAGRRDNEKARDTSIRVDTTRLDQVLNLSGEIGLTKNRLNALRSDILNGHTDTETLHALDQAVSQLDLLVSDMQNAVMKTRMQPVGRLFQKYPRIARDLARSLGKDVELVLVGEDTEIDKTMIEDLGDPIIHLIRNAVDHGVESSEERRAAGKPEKSHVRLEARQEGDHIVILINDDGRGMNAEKLRNKALEKGLITVEQANAMDERQSFDLVMLPGFSTKDVASDVSGRGVGMDVVKRNIEDAGGSISVHSEPGKGCAFRIRIPSAVTTQIIAAYVVEEDAALYALPLDWIRESFADPGEPGPARVILRHGAGMPVGDLASALGTRRASPWPERRTVVVVRDGDGSRGWAVDRTMGVRQVVIRPLHRAVRGDAGGCFEGAALLGDGRLALVIDPRKLLVRGS